jgi:hypothetical protein
MIETSLKQATLRKQNVKFVFLSWADGRTTRLFYSYTFVEKQTGENYSVADLPTKGYHSVQLVQAYCEEIRPYLQHLTV